MEEWISLKGFDNYLFSSYGRVKSLYKNIIRKQTINKTTKYMSLRLTINGKAKNYAVHRLIAKAFIPNSENKREVNHIDGDRTNNHSNNLEWVTRSENMIHAHKYGTASNKGSRNPRSIVTEDEVIDIHLRIEKGETLNSISKVYGTSISCISDIKHGRSWNNIQLKTKHKETIKEILLIRQNNKCLICGRDFKNIESFSICLDHNHKTWMVRAVLCRQCNVLEAKSNSAFIRTGAKNKGMDFTLFLKGLIKFQKVKDTSYRYPEKPKKRKKKRTKKVNTKSKRKVNKK